MNRDPYLSYATPEETGISSANITDFLLSMNEHEIMLHGFVMMRHGHVIAEGYYKPFTENTLHRIYSMTKSFTALAIGLLQDEGKLKITDPVINYFPEYMTEDLDVYMKEATIRELMMMASPQSYTTYEYEDDNWSRTFFEKKPSHPAGTIFSYDTSATDVLAALVDRLAGKPMIEYMKDRMLREVGFSEDAALICNPEGYSSGGSGIVCTPRDLAKVGHILKNGGRWGDKQMIFEEFVKQATSKQHDNNVTGFTDDPTLGYGYGYFIWRTWHNSYSFLGMGDQIVTVYPDQDMVTVFLCDNQYSPTGTTLIMERLWEHVISKAAPHPVPVVETEQEMLKGMIENLSMVVTVGEESSPWMDKVNGVVYDIDPDNPMGISRIKFTFEEDSGLLEYDTNRGSKKLRFGLGDFIEAELYEPQYSGRTFRHPCNRAYRVATVGLWPEENHLMISMQVIDDHVGNSLLHFVFLEDGRVSLRFYKHGEWFLREYHGFGKGKKAE